MSRKKKNHPEKTWPTQSLRAELAAITVAKRACDWATEVTWTVSYTAWQRRGRRYLRHRPKVCQRCFACSALARFARTSRSRFPFVLHERSSRSTLLRFSCFYTGFSALYMKDAIISVLLFVLDKFWRNLSALIRFFCTKLFTNVNGKAAARRRDPC